MENCHNWDDIHHIAEVERNQYSGYWEISESDIE